MNNSKGFVWLPTLLGVFAVLALSGGAWWYVQQEAPSAVQGQPSQSATTTDDTSGWKTFTHKEYGFEVGYPDGWKIFGANLTQGIIFGRKDRDATYDGELYLMLDPRSAAQLIQDQKTVERDRAGNSVVETKTVTVNGVEGTELIVHNSELQKTKPDWELHIVYFEKKGGYTYVLSNGAIKSDLFDTFYKSFRFVTSTTVSVSGMSKYTNAHYGFSFKYPSNLILNKQEDGFTSAGDVSLYVASGKYYPRISFKVATDTSMCSPKLVSGEGIAPTQSETISGNIFLYDVESDCGAGSCGRTRQYSIIKNNLCYRIQLSHYPINKGGNDNELVDVVKDILGTMKFTVL